MLTFVFAAIPVPGPSQVPRSLDRATTLDASIGPEQVHKYLLPLKRGESAELTILQQGVDLVVDVTAPDGKLIDTVDSPNGRDGPEPVAIVANKAGPYTVEVRPIAASEPVGKYRLTVDVLRDVAATDRWRLARRHARQLAVDWLRDHSIPIPAPARIEATTPMPSFDALAWRVKVMGLGEATHGSREFADLRLAVTRRLVEKHGYRIVALEQSESRMRALAPYVRGEAAADPSTAKLLESGWFGRRSRRELVEWARGWNLAHPTDLVRLVGVDAQDFAVSRAVVGRFLPRAYGEKLDQPWKTAEAELIAADEQSQVFGNSDVNNATRAFTVELLGMLEHDRPLLVLRLDPGAIDDAIEAARNLAQFSDYNGNRAGAINHNRDWYMAVNVLRALQNAPAAAKAVYWTHNAHVASTEAAYQPTGTVLRSALGCGYGAVGATFSEGSFIAQVPNDPEDRLAKTTLAKVGEDGLESALAGSADRGVFTAWPCGTGVNGVPGWLAQPRAMRWVGGVFTPGSADSTATRPFRLTSDFDGVFFIPTVTAETIPTDRSIIPSRKR